MLTLIVCTKKYYDKKNGTNDYYNKLKEYMEDTTKQMEIYLPITNSYIILKYILESNKSCMFWKGTKNCLEFRINDRDDDFNELKQSHIFDLRINLDSKKFSLCDVFPTFYNLGKCELVPEFNSIIFHIYKLEDPSNIYLVEQFAGGTWDRRKQDYVFSDYEVAGVFDDKEKAEAACKDENYCVMPLKMNEEFPEERVEVEVYYPKRKMEEK
jgi:hypothetical protein